MLLLIAWRNVWRNRLRSLIVIIAIALGLSGGIFLMSFSWGLQVSRTRDLIDTQLSHVQIHHPEFKEDLKPEFIIPQGNESFQKLVAELKPKAATSRLIVTGMIASAKAGSGVRINGIDPEQENQVTLLEERVTEGDYFAGIKRNPILIGRKLAEKLKVETRKKLVLTFQDKDGEIVAGAFRVVGFFESINSKYDESQVFVKKSDLQRILGQQGEIHEIAFLLHSDDGTEAAKAQISQAMPELLVEDWKDMAPDLRLIAESFDISMKIFIGIILLALAFGIVNTMLMAVLERTRELGMLMSIGMNKLRLFLMIVLETVFLCLIGGPLGILIGASLVSFFNKVGLDLSAIGEGLSDIGYSSMVYTALETRYYGEIGLMVVATAILASIYPAYKALKLKPAEAVRAI